MQIPLKQMVLRVNPSRKKPLILRPIETTQSQAQSLANLYINIVRIWQVGARDDILPAYAQTLAQDATTRDSVSDVQIAIDAVNNRVVTALFDFARLWGQWADGLQLWHMTKFIAQIKYATNVDLSTLIDPQDEQLTLAQYLARNVALVRDVSDQTRGRISDSVFRGLQNRTPIREIAKEISTATGLARDRAVRIASDQTVKLAASLDRERQTQMGMTKFEWRSSHKRHFRPEHAARDHKIFEWDSDVGRNDPPGFLPFCGCVAKGVLELD